MKRGSIHALGIVMLVFGGAGLAEISTSNHGCFWLCNILFSLGLGICIMGFKRNE